MDGLGGGGDGGIGDEFRVLHQKVRRGALGALEGIINGLQAEQHLRRQA